MRGKIIVAWLAGIWLICCAFSAKIYDPSKRSNTAVAASTISVGVAPILFSSVMYTLTYHELKKQSRNLALESISNRQHEAKILKEKRFLRTIILVACIAVACIVPSTVEFNYRVFHKSFKDNQKDLVVRGIFFGIFYFNYAVNPLLYGLRLPNYRKTFYLLYCWKVTQ